MNFNYWILANRGWQNTNPQKVTGTLHSPVKVCAQSGMSHSQQLALLATDSTSRMAKCHGTSVTALEPANTCLLLLIKLINQISSYSRTLFNVPPHKIFLNVRFKSTASQEILNPFQTVDDTVWTMHIILHRQSAFIHSIYCTLLASFQGKKPRLCDLCGRDPHCWS